MTGRTMYDLPELAMPRPAEREGYVYVIAFSSGTVKVGRTRDHAQRLKVYESDTRRFGVTITGYWLSPPHAEWEQNENVLKEIAYSLGGTLSAGREYFSGISFTEVVARACSLTFTPSEAERLEREAAVRCEAVKAAAKSEEIRLLVGGVFLQLGMTPERMRDFPGGDNGIADAMETVLHHEELVRQQEAA